MTAFVTSCVETVSGSAAAAERRRPRAAAGTPAASSCSTQAQRPDHHAPSTPTRTRWRASTASAGCWKPSPPDGAPRPPPPSGVAGGRRQRLFVRHSNFVPAPLGRIEAWATTTPSCCSTRKPSSRTARCERRKADRRDRPPPRAGAPAGVRSATCGPTVGATRGRIVFSYFLELDVPIDASLAATLLYAIETDLAGAAGTPGNSTHALSQLTLIADTAQALPDAVRPLRRAITRVHEGLQNAVFWEGAVMKATWPTFDSLEKPAMIATSCSGSTGQLGAGDRRLREQAAPELRTET